VSKVSLLLVFLAGCTDAALTREERLDPQSCAGCHPTTVREWSGSMHAYSSVDPVFRAMNARGQREAQLGSFCVKCHAPVALAEGATTDGTNLDQVPAHLQGITCVFCHEIDAVTGTHDAALTRANDGVMRGGIADPFETPAHESQYSPLHDRKTLESSQICGSCHDIVTPRGVALERGFEEWKGSLYSSPSSIERVSCQGCHMPSKDGRVADVEGAPVRRLKSHAFPAVDQALTPFPEIEAQAALIEQELATVLQASLCVYPFANGSTVAITLENIAAGHHFPSGASHDRRAWLELVATIGDRTVFSSGVDGPSAPDTWLFRDHVTKDDGTEALMFWDVAHVEPSILPAPATRDPLDPRFAATHRTRTFSIPKPTPEVIRARIRLQPIASEVLDSLVASGDLDPAIAARMPIHDLRSTVMEWRAADGKFCAGER